MTMQPASERAALAAMGNVLGSDMLDAVYAGISHAMTPVARADRGRSHDLRADAQAQCVYPWRKRAARRAVRALDAHVAPTDPA